MGQTTSKSAGDDGKPKPKTTSAAAAAAAVESETATGSMTMRIAGYSQTKGIGVGNSINSSKFQFGGHTWYIAYYPDGDREEYSDWVSVYLCLSRPAAAAAADDVVEAKFTLSLLSGTCGAVVEEKIFSVKKFSFANGYWPSWGHTRFIKRKKLDSRLWSCLHLDGQSFYIRCDITMDITSGGRRCQAATAAVAVPPPDLHRHLAALLGSGVGADVRIKVGGKLFAAHKNVLAARSPVFMAELFGNNGGKDQKETTKAAAATGNGVIRIDDMDLRVFRAMLQFIYTDTLPSIDKGDMAFMAQNLLVAAHRYGIERLKSISVDMIRKGA
uniref:BTB/POZ domain containing protein-like n=2 Tax=Oryza nivara TaxID=4536 RepID=A0A679BCG4_ORYNI|nr:BTB/POZ domain containing protein -like [Oryza sativa f. spontanea]BBF89884.1 BTB/POZ domain containing protein -like [Oryza sativa f. spontanea]